MKKSIYRILSLVLSLVVLLSNVFSLVIRAEEYNYEYTDIDPEVATRESFEEIFGSPRINKVMYSYFIYDLGNSESEVIVIFTIQVGGKDYPAMAEGIVGSYPLSSGSIFFEGPIRGSISINGDLFKLTLGFAKKDSMDKVMISATIMSPSGSIVAFSFGDYFFDNEIENLFRTKTVECNNQSILTNSTISSASSENSYSTMVFGGGIEDPNASIYDPPYGGGGGSSMLLSLGENGEYEYQNSTIVKRGATDYSAYKSGVYFDKSKNLLMVTVKPFSADTQSYAEKYYVDDGVYDFVQTRLYSIGMELILTDVPSSNYAFIANIDKPQATTTINNFYNNANVLLLPLFSDILGIIGIPTSTVSAIFNELMGRVVANDSRLIANIDIQFPLIQLGNPNQIEDLEYGLPIRFQLSKGSSSYIGDTPYTVNTCVVYQASCQVTPFLSEPQNMFFYITQDYTYEGVIDLG